MKNLLIAFIITATTLSCSSTKKIDQQTSSEDAVSKPNKTTATVSLGADEEQDKAAIAIEESTPKKTMLIGVEDRQALTLEPFARWYTTNYNNYQVKKDYIPELKKAFNDVEITTFMGTWCGDSKRETPRFFKILDTAGFEEGRSALITVDRTKQNPKEFTEGKNIRRVPTFIFTRNGEEIGRIVERPVESLEADMLKILTGEPYKHAYEK